MMNNVRQDHPTNRKFSKLLIFGGSPQRMSEVKKLLSQIDNLEVLGTLSEEEGLQMYDANENVDLILIGGRYTDNQRKRIKNAVGKTPITEPGVAYPYSNENIFLHTRKFFSTIGH